MENQAVKRKKRSTVFERSNCPVHSTHLVAIDAVEAQRRALAMLEEQVESGSR